MAEGKQCDIVSSATEGEGTSASETPVGAAGVNATRPGSSGTSASGTALDAPGVNATGPVVAAVKNVEGRNETGLRVGNEGVTSGTAVIANVNTSGGGGGSVTGIHSAGPVAAPVVEVSVGMSAEEATKAAELLTARFKR